MSQVMTWLTQRMLDLQKRSFYVVLRQTMIVLFPFALVGSFARVLRTALLDPQGFGGTILQVTKWLPHYQGLHTLVGSFESLTLGIIAVLAAYHAASETAALYKQDKQIAGTTGLLTYALLFLTQVSATGQLSITSGAFHMQSLLYGLGVGYVVGQIFRWWGRHLSVLTDEAIIARSFSALPAIGTCFVLCALIMTGMWLWGGAGKAQLVSLILGWEQHLVTGHWAWLGVIVLTLLTSLCQIIGLTGPLTMSNALSGSAFYENLAYALHHSNLQHVPNRFTDYTLYQSFGRFGGPGATLALIIAIVLVSRHRSTNMLAAWATIPTLFEVGLPLMIGIPLFLNPLYVIPFVVAPVVNVVVAALLIQMGAIIPAVYPVPLGTPGPLIAYLGTNGHWLCLMVGVLLLVLDVLIYFPFVRIADDVQEQLLIAKVTAEGGRRDAPKTN